MVVDPTEEIAGGGDVPHTCIGTARRMLGAMRQTKYEVLEEAVANHGPEVHLVASFTAVQLLCLCVISSNWEGTMLTSCKLFWVFFCCIWVLLAVPACCRPASGLAVLPVMHVAPFMLVLFLLTFAQQSSASRRRTACFDHAHCQQLVCKYTKCSNQEVAGQQG